MKYQEKLANERERGVADWTVVLRERKGQDDQSWPIKWLEYNNYPRDKALYLLAMEFRIFSA